MAAHTNIQILFAAITVSGVQQYLLDHGWADEPAGNDRLYFERDRAPGEEPSTIWTWATNEHPKFRSQIPNLTFTLSILENRPALEIANEIYAARSEKAATKAELASAAPAAASQAAGDSGPTVANKTQACVLRLTHATALMIPLDLLDEKVEIAAGDVVEIVYVGPPNSELDLQIGDGVIQVRIPRDAGVRLLQGVAKPCLGDRWSASKIVREELVVLEDAGESKAAAELLDTLGPTLARIDFELDPEGETGATMQHALRRQAAVLASGIAPARRHASGPASRMAPCAKLLYPVGLRLELMSNSVDELYAAAATDEELSPKKTLTWLKEHGISIA